MESPCLAPCFGLGGLVVVNSVNMNAGGGVTGLDRSPHTIGIYIIFFWKMFLCKVL